MKSFSSNILFVMLFRRYLHIIDDICKTFHAKIHEKRYLVNLYFFILYNGNIKEVVEFLCSKFNFHSMKLRSRLFLTPMIVCSKPKLLVLGIAIVIRSIWTSHWVAYIFSRNLSLRLNCSTGRDCDYGFQSI